MHIIKTILLYTHTYKNSSDKRCGAAGASHICKIYGNVLARSCLKRRRNSGKIKTRAVCWKPAIENRNANCAVEYYSMTNSTI